MLPLHYCDYLLAIYTQGQEFTEVGRRSRIKQMQMITMLVFAVILPFAVFILYFTELSFFLQTVILTSFVVCFLLFAIYFSRKKLLAPLLFLGAAVLMLLLSLKLNTIFFNNQLSTLYGLLSLNCLAWIYTGIQLRLFYFTLSGTLGLFVILFFFLKG